MRLRLFDLDLTLGCGQVFRWRREGEWWRGVLGERQVRLRQVREDLDIWGAVSDSLLRRYFRDDDDIDSIVKDISRDPYVAGLVRKYRGLRLIRQDPWECAASYTLATYASIPRIEGMIENVCRTFGRKLNGRYSFPTPAQVLERKEAAAECNLGFRCGRFVEFARKVAEGEVDFEELRGVGYEDCVSKLKRLDGVGDKVADCIALFALDHLEAFPVDVRIARAMKNVYGVTGSYRKVSSFAREHFGRYAGYAQEYIYVSEERKRKDR